MNLFSILGVKANGENPQVQVRTATKDQGKADAACKMFGAGFFSKAEYIGLEQQNKFASYFTDPAHEWNCLEKQF